MPLCRLDYAKNYLANYRKAYKAGAAAAGVGIPASYGDIATSSDPMQSLINGLENSESPSISKPTYMWVCNQASGAAVEVGGSGFDLDQNTGVDVNQTPTVLSGANVCVFDADTDVLSNNSDSGLQPLSDSFFALAIVGLHTMAGTTGRIFGDKNGADSGWYIASDTSNNWDSFIEDTAGFLGSAHNLAGELANNSLQVLGLQINRTTDVQTLMSNNATPKTDVDISDLLADINSGAGQTCGFGDIQSAVGTCGRFEAGVLAIWKGAPAEAITSTMVANLFSALGGT